MTLIRRLTQNKLRLEETLIVLAVCCFFLEDVANLVEPGNIGRLGLSLFALSFLVRGRHG